MVFQLKEYQQRCLDELGAFFRETNRRCAADEAFYAKTKRPYRDVEELPGLPYVCLRVPTGGGKTVMASHAVGVAASELLLTDRCLVFWLAPTTQIVSQTIEALRDKQHPYRQALDTAFGGSVTVMDLPAALSLKPGTLQSDTVIIVSTIQAPRVGDKEGRKVYAEDNGSLMEHFENLTAGQLELLDKIEGTDKPGRSLANVFKLHRPVIIVDEAHNARTPLSFETLARFNPSCIVEFTATPADDSNILTHVSAAELKAEEMIKLPIRLYIRPQWKEAVDEAVAMQASLEKTAKEEEKESGEYIRPIVLLQAQPKGKGNITFDIVKQSLLDDFDIPEDQILIATGAKNELDGVDVLASDCPVRFIITVAKLREGWDCPFAYILCSVSNLSSHTAVEQVMGRVLRMPHARKKKHADLNHAYAFVTSQGFADAATALTEALVDSGFDRYEAKASIKPQKDPMLPLDMPLWETTSVTEVLQGKLTAEAIPKTVRNHVQTAPTKEETLITYSGPPISPPDEAKWSNALSSEDEKNAVARLARKSRGEDAWPAAMGRRFEIPSLAVLDGEQLDFFEDQFREGSWSLSECDSLLTEQEFSLDSVDQTGAEIDVEDGRLAWHSFTENLHRQLSFLDSRGPRTPAEVALWLDRNIAHPDITQPEAALYMSKVVRDLQKQRGMTMERITADRFRLRDAVAQKIRNLRRDAVTQAYHQMLLPECSTPLQASPECCFKFPLNQYPAPSIYEGPIQFQKHYYERPAEMNKEEADCAVLLDSLPEVDFWVRNLERDRYAFWLQTPADKFYPDFVAKLKDGRFLVIEYKGVHLLNEDTSEKEQLGQLWEARSKGLCVFRLITKANMKTAIPSAVRKE